MKTSLIKNTALFEKSLNALLELFTVEVLQEKLAAKTRADVKKALVAERLDIEDYLSLLSSTAGDFLEEMARKAKSETLRSFGKTVQLFTPLYLANLCTNACVYCGFNKAQHIVRQVLTLAEVEEQAKIIAATGLRRILVLTGDAPSKTGATYVASCIEVISKYFSSIGVEIPSMQQEEYALLVSAGVDSMTLFQETYNRELYAELHPSGPKRNFNFRLEAPERAIKGGIRNVNLGALLGLDDWRKDSFFTGLHAAFLQYKYPEVEVSVSFPRIRPCTSAKDIKAAPFTIHTVDDRQFVQSILAFRCFMPSAGITLSTREPALLRDKLLPLGITRVSAGVSTCVGGHGEKQETGKTPPQFEIDDKRTVQEMAKSIENLGYQPVYADWLLPGKALSCISSSVAHALGSNIKECL